MCSQAPLTNLSGPLPQVALLHDVRRVAYLFLVLAHGARTAAEARGYFVSRMRRFVGVFTAREMARHTHRLHRVPLVGVPVLPWKSCFGRGEGAPCEFGFPFLFLMGLGDKVAARLATGGSGKESGPTRAGKERPGSAPKQRSAGGQPVRGGAAAASSSAGAATPSQPPAAQAAVNDMPAPAAQQPPPPNRLDRQYSTASWNTVSTLQQLELEVEAMEKQTTDHEDTLDNPPPDGLPLGMRNQMAQVCRHAVSLCKAAQARVADLPKPWLTAPASLRATAPRRLQ